MEQSLNLKMPALRRLCEQCHVSRLELFGSATGEGFDPDRSDYDFLVRFDGLTPVAHARAYFDLLEGLESLLGRQVDLVELSAVTNPYFLQVAAQSRVTVYAP